ncbi:MAG: sugar ABC transporter substrate-binding protein [Acidimicrobiales bacterium]
MSQPKLRDGLVSRAIAFRSILRGVGVAGAGLALGAMLTVGCVESASAHADSNTPKKIAFAFPYTEVGVYKPIIGGALAEAKKLHVSVLQSTTGGTSGKQLSELETWMAEGVNGIVLFPLDQGAMGPIVSKAHQDGIKVIGYATQLPGEQGLINWNTPRGNRAIGFAAAAWVNKVKHGHAEVALLTQNQVPVGRSRIQQELAALHKKAPGAKVVATAQAATGSSSLSVARSMLQAHPTISVFLCVNDTDQVGVARAIQQAGKPAKDFFLTGTDGTLTALKMIKSGRINGADGALPLRTIGIDVTRFAYDAIVGKKPTKKVFTYVVASNHNPKVVKKLIAAFGS